MVVTSDLEHMSDYAERLIVSVTYPIFEQHLATSITGESDPERALRKLRRLNGGMLVMTRGELGSVALEGDAFHVAPAFKVKVVDGTGAGDVFRAGFIYGLLQDVGGPRHPSFRKCGRGARAALSWAPYRRYPGSAKATNCWPRTG